MRAIFLAICLIVAAQPGYGAQVWDVAGMRDVGPPLSRAELDRFLSQLRSDEMSVRTVAVLALSNREILPEQAREMVPLVAAMLRQWPALPKPYPPGSLTPHNVALRFFQQLGPLAKPALPEVLAALRFDDPFIRWWAINTLNSLKLLPDESGQALDAVIVVLEREHTPDATIARRQEALEIARIGRDARSSMEAGMAFGAWLPQSAWPDGVGIGFSTELTFDAFRFLQQLGPAAAPATPVLLRLKEIESPRLDLEQSVDRTLAAIGSGAADAIPDLVRQLNGSEPTSHLENPQWPSAFDESLLAIMEIDIKDPRVRRPILAGFERYITSLQRADARPVFPTAINLAIARLGPVDIETVRTVVRAISTAPDAAFEYSGNWAGYRAPSLEFVPMLDRFLSQLTPGLAETREDFLKLARSGRPREQQYGFTALQKLGGIPEEFIPLFVAWLRLPTQPNVYERRTNWAFENLGSMGPRAAPAVPALIEALKSSDPSQWYWAIEALAKIGPEAARSAIPELERRVTDLNTRPDMLYSGFFDHFLTIDLGSTIARTELERMISTQNSIIVAAGARGVLLKHGLDSELHRSALFAILDNPDMKLALAAATILARDGIGRTRAIDRILDLVSSGTVAEALERAEPVRSLELLLPGDARSESRLMSLIRSRLSELREETTGYDLTRSVIQSRGESELAALIRTLARFETKSPEATALLTMLRRDPSATIRNAAAGRRYRDD